MRLRAIARSRSRATSTGLWGLFISALSLYSSSCQPIMNVFASGVESSRLPWGLLDQMSVWAAASLSSSGRGSRNGQRVQSVESGRSEPVADISS